MEPARVGFRMPPLTSESYGELEKVWGIITEKKTIYCWSIVTLKIHLWEWLQLIDVLLLCYAGLWNNGQVFTTTKMKSATFRVEAVAAGGFGSKHRLKVHLESSSRQLRCSLWR